MPPKLDQTPSQVLGGGLPLVRNLLSRKSAGGKEVLSMSTNVVLIVVGVVLFVAGLAKVGSNQSGGFNLSNLGINIGGTNTQKNKLGNVASSAKDTKPDWIGLTIAAIGLLTALAGLLKDSPR
jgi:hypothetical protein